MINIYTTTMNLLVPPDPQEPLGTADLKEDGDFSDMLSEQRILLPGAQMLTAFLIILPFNGGFRQIVQTEKIVFLATFVLALTSLVLLSAPAIQHRLMRPLNDRARFKRVATYQIVAGAFTLALALILATNLVISEVFGTVVGLAMAATIATFILCLWWLLPAYLKRMHGF
ncbi:Integral membrane protein [Janthinobacterium sp. CG23_2]|nr:Integral membrane protein [Janthinobacterium sp. CG23_2]CUU28829.1 Integral membrane protein [Janthinobacterium sp. CG23_2]